MQNEKASIFTEEQEQRLIALKGTFPFRICWGAVKDNEFELHADYTRHKLNRYLKNGWLVCTAN